jgi:hypothetical protein
MSLAKLIWTTSSMLREDMKPSVSSRRFKSGDHLVRKSLSRKCKVLFLPSGNDPLFQVEPSPDGAQQDRDQYRDESVELARFDKLSDQEGHAK